MNDEQDISAKKIIIDEDWKTKVAAERAAESHEADVTPVAPPAVPTEDSPQGVGKLPPASFDMLLTTLATEAMMSLGQMPIPGQQQPEVNLPQAQYVIDLLSVLQEKTKGNLSPEETTLLEDLLHQLRMMYVAVEK
jgi:hypothetical protein